VRPDKSGPISYKNPATGSILSPLTSAKVTIRNEFEGFRGC